MRVPSAIGFQFRLMSHFPLTSVYVDELTTLHNHAPAVPQLFSSFGYQAIPPHPNCHQEIDGHRLQILPSMMQQSNTEPVHARLSFMPHSAPSVLNSNTHKSIQIHLVPRGNRDHLRRYKVVYIQWDTKSNQGLASYDINQVTKI
jgi:hypothetical protein